VNKDKVINDLLKRISDLEFEVEKQDKEIERLNNIINEFEEWLNNIPNYFMDRRSNNTGVYVQKGMQQMIDMCNNKLQELKGSDKE
jgi:prefoldin subunit 5